MGEIIKHDEEQTPIKVSMDSVPVGEAVKYRDQRLTCGRESNYCNV